MKKILSSCDKRILKITQKPIEDAENTARKTVPKIRLLEDSARDRQPIACSIWGCLGPIILSQELCRYRMQKVFLYFSCGNVEYNKFSWPKD
jgi:hypothetical protein